MFDPRVFAAAFATVFLAELGDKTQIAALALAAETGKPWTVFLGAALALAASTLLAVGAAHLLRESGWLAPARLRVLAGMLFVALGLWFLLHRPAG